MKLEQVKKILRTKPLHTFLIGLYFIAFIFVRNMNKLTVSMTFRSILINLIFSGILFGISFLFLRSGRKAGIFSTFFLIGFFTYGIIYNQLEQLFYKGWWPFSHIHRFLLLTYFLFYLFLFVLFYRSHRPHYTVNYILNVSVLIVFIMNIPLLLLSFEKKNNPLHSENPFINANSQNINSGYTSNDSSHDIYYIILDSYASEKTLNDFFSEHNPALYNFLREKGFYVANSSRTNYPYTNPSLSCSLNMNYLDSVSNQSNELIRQNLVSYLFKKNNYKVITIKSGYAVTENLAFADKTIKISSLNEFENRLLELTLLRLDDVLGFSHYMRLKSQMSQLKLFLKEKGPKFSFIHIVSPHPPFVMDSSGNRKIRSSVSDMAWEPRKNYVQQLKYVSGKIMEFVDSILANSKTQPVIILQSDHGPWISDKNPKHVYDARIQILNAYYVPDSIKARLYPGISPVNSFRLIFSRLFNKNYLPLPDQPFPFSELIKDVTFKKYNE